MHLTTGRIFIFGVLKKTGSEKCTNSPPVKPNDTQKQFLTFSEIKGQLKVGIGFEPKILTQKVNVLPIHSPTNAINL